MSENELRNTSAMPTITKDLFESASESSMQDKEKISAPSLSFMADSWRRLKKNKVAMVSLIILIIISMSSLLAPVIAPHDPNAQTVQYANMPPKIPGIENHIIRADSARPESTSYLKRNGLPRTVSVEKWPGSVEDGVAHLRSYAEIVIHPRCVETIREARLWSYKVDRLTGDVLPVLVDANNHYWDAARYALAPIIQRRDAGATGVRINGL